MRPPRSLAVGMALVAATSALLCSCAQDWDVGPEDGGDSKCEASRASVSEKLHVAQTCTIPLSVCYADQSVADECGCPVPVASPNPLDSRTTDYLRAVSDLTKSGCALDCPDACTPAENIDAWCTTDGAESTCMIR